MRRTILPALVFFCTCHFAALAQQTSNSPGDWAMYGRNYASTSFSPLSEITPANVSKLMQICSYSLPENVPFESSLVAINGTLYFTTGAYTYALNSADCS